MPGPKRQQNWIQIAKELEDAARELRATNERLVRRLEYMAERLQEREEDNGRQQ